MDYFAHGFWSYIIFHRVRRPWLAVLFGLLPDTLSWFIYAIYGLFAGGFMMGKPHLTQIDGWAFTLYNISHSLVMWGLIVIILCFIMKKFPSFVYAAPIAIMMDIPTHSREFLPTPFLWPISEWKFPGFSWGQHWFMIMNYLAIFTALYLIYKNKRKA